jgi:hypothetical protein
MAKLTKEEIVSKVESWLADPENVEALRETFKEADRLAEELTQKTLPSAWTKPFEPQETIVGLKAELESLRQELARKDEALFRNLLAEAIERVMPGMEGQTFADEEIAGEFCLRAKAALSPQADKEVQV